MRFLVDNFVHLVNLVHVYNDDKNLAASDCHEANADTKD